MNDTGRSILIVVVVLITLPLLWGGIMMGGGMGMMGGWGSVDGWDRWDPWRATLGIPGRVLTKVAGSVTFLGAPI